MLICTRCNTTKLGNRVTYTRCECGGQYAVIRDGCENSDFESDGPKELFFGDDTNKKFPRQTVTLSPNRKVMRKTESHGQEGVSYGESNLLEM